MGAKTSEAKLLPMFVYGTLRPGHYNWSLIERDVVELQRNATIQGRLYWAYTVGSYPVANIHQEGTIVGDLVVMDRESNGFYFACQMEIGAGYEPWQVPVTLEDGTRRSAIVWHYPLFIQGDRIVDGDWEAAIQALERSKR